MNDNHIHAQKYFLKNYVIDEETNLQNLNSFLPVLLKNLEWQGDQRTLRDALPFGSHKLGFTELLNTLSFLGYSPKLFRTKKSKFSKNSLPALFFSDKDKNKEKCSLITSIDKIPKDGTLCVFKPNTDTHDIITDRTIAASDLKWFTKLLLRFKKIFVQIICAGFFINILTLATPLFIMSIYDKIIGAHSSSTLPYFIIGVLLAICIEFMLRYLRTKSIAWFGARLDYIVSNTIIEHLLNLPASFTERASVTAQLSRLKAFESIRDFFTGNVFMTLMDVPFTLVLFITIIMIAGDIALIPAIVCVCYLLLIHTMTPKLKALSARTSNANTERQNMHIETLNKQEVLRYAGGFDAWMERYEKICAEASYAQYRYQQALSLIDIISQALSILAGTAIIYFGVEKIFAGHLSNGAMIALLILNWRLLSPLQATCAALPRLNQIKQNCNQINSLMTIPKERILYRHSPQNITFKGQIEFKNVGLRYSKDSDPIYAGLSFNIKQGQLVAIVGNNSTGKSTTLKLISGLYQPQAGAIRIDGNDIRQIDPVILRQNIAYVAQEPKFFSGSVKENFQLVNPSINNDEIMHILERVGLKTWIENLPDALETKIQHNYKNELARTIGPQLGLARAIIQNSPILLIDEMPYEFLNSEPGNLFKNFLINEHGKRTIIFITYRQDYIDLADLIIQLHPDSPPLIKEKTYAA